VIGGRPAGCPSSYCGCGAALRVFGRVIPELNPAANWLRFPRTSPAPGMVAARHGHVFVPGQHLGRHVDGVRRQLWRACNTDSCSLIARIYSRESARNLIENPSVYCGDSATKPLSRNL
jgi:hypothetical protein